jgi:lambda family phage minor tail protein L
MTAIQTVAQSLSPDAIVELFTLDTTSVGGPILRFVQGKETNGQELRHNGQVYVAIDIEFSGLETTGVGALPTPKVKISNSDSVIQAIVNTYGDILGCPLYRIRTFARFLDNGSEPDPLAFYGPDQFRVERRSDDVPTFIEWELSTSIDQEGKMLPGRQVIRDTCLWRYRAWDASSGTFDYSRAQCPFAGNKYYDINDQEVANPADDRPSRRIGCCEARFGVGSPLPFGGFPGVARIRA